jgi:phospholipid/cholesterol/gamma-HCH transport system ATP-binding protein
VIQITELKKSFGTKQVLRGINLTIKEGETVAIIGESGCGKSVLLKHIIGLLFPDEGTVSIDGLEITTASERDIFGIRRQIGFLFQNSALFDSMTVYENITLGLWEGGIRDEKQLHEIARTKLDLVGLHGIEDRNPAELSGGMRKRVGLARALAMEPKYMFYDEPTTGLDPVTSNQIDNLIANLTHKLPVTSLIVTHDLFTVRNIAKRVVYIVEGKIYFDGTPETLIESDDLMISRFVNRFIK